MTQENQQFVDEKMKQIRSALVATKKLLNRGYFHGRDSQVVVQLQQFFTNMLAGVDAAKAPEQSNETKTPTSA